MLREFGLELSSLINSNPAWKVSKGRRSASRRVRKTVSKSLKNSGLVCQILDGLDMPVSEKHGVSALGCRFSEKAEHVPIKKRRFLLRSPSPPPPAISSSSPTEEAGEFIKSQNASNKIESLDSPSLDVDSSQIIHNNISIHDKKSHKIDRFCEDEDFSGISILAAAACSSSSGKDCCYAEDNSGVEESSVKGRVTNIEASSLSARLLTENLIKSSKMSSNLDSSQKVVTAGKSTNGDSIGVNSLRLSGDVSCSKDEEIVGNKRQSSRDDRLHWDLNVSMGAWEHDSEHPDSHRDGSGKVNHDDFIVSVEGHNLRDKLAKTCSGQNSLLPDEPRALTSQTLEGTKGNHDLGDFHNVDQHTTLTEKALLSNCKNNLDVVKSKVEDIERMRHPETVNPADGLVVTSSDDITQPCKEIMAGLNSSVGMSSCELENLRIVNASHAICSTPSADVKMSLCVPSSSDNQMKVASNVAVWNHIETFQKSHSYGYDPLEKVDLKTIEPRDHAHVTSDGVSNIQGGNLCRNNETTMILSEIPPATSIESYVSVCHDTCKADFDNCSNISDKIDTVDVHTHPVSVLGTNVASELQENYDSQYEDGELREPREHAWEEYDVVDREDEHVDYGLDNLETYATHPTGYHVSDLGQSEDRKDISPAIVSSSACIIDSEVCGDDRDYYSGDDKIKWSHSAEEKMKAPTSKELLESTKNSSDDNGRKDRMSGHDDDRLVDPKGIEARVESKAFRRGLLQSRIEGPVPRDGSSREEPNKMENRYEESRSMRSFERVRYPFHNQARGQQGWDGSSDSRMGIKRHYSPVIHGHSKLDDDAVEERDNIGCDDAQGDVSYSDQFLQKNRSAANEDACTGLNSRYKPHRRFSPDSRAAPFGRGRPIGYGPLVDRRAGRGRYNGPSPDESFQSSLKYRRPLSRQERSLSPFGGRRHPYPHDSRGKSPSRSRSRSPVMWHFRGGRPGSRGGVNTFHRHQGRSPSFRSEVRMEGLRSPRQPGFGADHAEGFRSIPRRRGSPPHGRWNSPRNDNLGHFREFGYKQPTSALERSPGRIGMRGDRADVIDSQRNLRPDGYNGRFSNRFPEDGFSRGHRYDKNYEDKRKHYGLVHHARRNYEDGMSRRLHQDIDDDSFSMENNNRDRECSSFQGTGRGRGRGFRAIDSRVGDLPRRLRGEQDSFMYERDRMDSSRSPSSKEQYRSHNTGQFTEIGGVNRGRRYENYEDRRKHYGPANLMRHSDREDTHRRLNHNVDGNFQDVTDFRSRVSRGSDGPLKEGQGPVTCGEEEKLDDNPQSLVAQNSDDNEQKK